MNQSDIDIIKNEIAPAINSGEISLLLGAGFSITNKTQRGRLPSGEGLRDLILSECNLTAGPKTTLKDAYVLGSRQIANFSGFLSSCFVVQDAEPWQLKMFQYAWNRVYTTNIDNVLNVACEKQSGVGKLGGDFKFFNYSDQGVLSDTIGSIPVVTIHGTCLKLDEGFIFSTLEYAKASTKVYDWHRDLAAKILTGGLVVIGNQLEETDIDTYLAARISDYPHADTSANNWIVMPNPDVIKMANYEANGFRVLDCTAEEFFNTLFSSVGAKSIGEIMVENVPQIKKVVANVKSLTWFKGAFSYVASEIESAASKTGIVRHFITGADPEWFYIYNEAHAKIGKQEVLSSTLGRLLRENQVGLGVLHVVGPSGSGKSTAIRVALQSLSTSYRCVYEFNDGAELSTSYLRSVIENLGEKSVFVFYSASEYYYSISYLSDALSEKKKPYCLFVLEERSHEHERNKRQLTLRFEANYLRMGHLSLRDAESIANKIDYHGFDFPNFSKKSISARARVILDKERGYSGDLLTTLFSLTSNENFEKKIFEDYQTVQDGLPKQILNLVVVINQLGHQPPLSYVAGIFGISVDAVLNELASGLSGIVVLNQKTMTLKLRHRVIAEFYYKNCIAKNGQVDLIVSALIFLSRQFTVDDIKFHPLAYKIYKDIISYNFLYKIHYPTNSRSADTERTYHEVQQYFGRDGIFWLHFGRYYRKTGRLENAITCFRTGLGYYDSFQTRHSLGMALLETFIEGNGVDAEAYTEGVVLLDNERISRGNTDAYPCTTMIGLLQQIEKIPNHKTDAGTRLKICINMGLEHFRDDPHFNSILKNQFV
ncbi:SIR2 family protein [Pseudomonas sp. Ld6]|uniref:P-loop NTPase n=1 Tax=Pseudomonas sp. Ld6 TaxID=649167 RepID=UPI003868374F